jgi:predicted enzyme related to lactoylglutathione lyase
MTVHGKFVWHDLMSSDVQKSIRFYGELFGWQIKKDDNSPYHLILLEGRDIGGMLPLEKKMGPMPPHWIGYIAVENIDQTLAEIPKLGGKVYMPKTSIEKVGLFAVAADPQGAVFSPFQYGATQPKPETDARPAPSSFCWDELATSDTHAAETFYRTLFKWGANEMDMGPMGTYTVFTRGVKGADGNDKNAGGMMPKSPQAPASQWLSYVGVTHCDQSVERAKKLGGSVLVPPTDIPNVGRFSVLHDNVGAAIGILQGA